MRAGNLPRYCSSLTLSAVESSFRLTTGSNAPETALPAVTAPVAKAAVVGAAVSPGPSPIAKAAVVGAAVSPGPSPIAKAAVVGAVVTPGRRRF